MSSDDQKKKPDTMDVDEKKDEQKNEAKQDNESPKSKKSKDDDVLKSESLNEEEIRLMKAYSLGPYDDEIKALQKQQKARIKDIEDAQGIKESDRGLAPPSMWDLNNDKMALQQGMII